MTREDAAALWDSLTLAGRSKALYALRLKSNNLQASFDDLPVAVQELLHQGWHDRTLTPFKERGTA